MNRCVPLASGLVGALLLVGCGQQVAQQATRPASVPASVGSCSPDSAKVTGAAKVATVDLDGDGTPDQVSLTASDATGCASYVVATVGGHVQGSPIGDVDPATTTWTAVSVPGRSGQLLVARASNPRGGYQDILYAASGTTFGPVVDAAKKPLQLPFVATDSPGGYVSACLTDGGFVVRQALAADPATGAATYDIEATAYSLSGLTATVGAVKKEATGVPADRLRAAYPALVEREAFTTGCSA